MLDITKIIQIREAYAKGYTKSEICRMLGFDIKTVTKYIQQDDFSPKPPIKRKRSSILDPYRDLIDQWLMEDGTRSTKKEHTAQRIYERLKIDHGYEGSYPTVQRYVRQWLNEHHEDQ